MDVWFGLWFEKNKQTKSFMGERLPVFYFDRTSVKEGVDLESQKEYHKFIDETLSKRYGCCVIFYNKSNFNLQERTCDVTKFYKVPALNLNKFMSYGGTIASTEY